MSKEPPTFAGSASKMRRHGCAPSRSRTCVNGDVRSNASIKFTLAECLCVCVCEKRKDAVSMQRDGIHRNLENRLGAGRRAMTYHR